MKKIFKYRLKRTADLIDIPIIVDSQLLSVGQQSGEFYIWAMVDIDNSFVYERRYFRIVGTGAYINDEIISVLGRVVDYDTGVYHILEVKGPEPT